MEDMEADVPLELRRAYGHVPLPSVVADVELDVRSSRFFILGSELDRVQVDPSSPWVSVQRALDRGVDSGRLSTHTSCRLAAASIAQNPAPGSEPFSARRQGRQ